MVQSKNIWKSPIIILVTILFGLLIRVYITPLNQQGDIQVHQEWSRIIYQQRPLGSYFFSNWTYTPPTQPPLMLLGFWTSQHIYQNRYLLSQIHNQIHLPPASFIIWFDKNGEWLLLKSWAILGDILSALIVYILVKNITHNYLYAYLGIIFVLFNPVSIFESAYWGQNDIVGALFLYLSLYLLLSLRYSYLSLPLFIISVLLKPTTLILSPLLLYVFIQKFNYSLLLQQLIGLVFSLIILIICFQPFVKSTLEIKDIISQRIVTSAKGTVKASHSAFNFYSLVFTLDKTNADYKIFNIPLSTYSILIYLLLNLTIAIFILKSKPSIVNYLVSAYILSQGSFLFMTGMMERYFFPAFLAATILMTINFHHLKYVLFLQQICWFINLVFARPQSVILVKSFSLISLCLFFYIFYTTIYPLIASNSTAANHQDV
ncbi:MAG: hypothetical protein WAV41_04830 [Microgenomates group bacterium]